MVGYLLPLLRPGVPHHVGGDVGLYQVGRSEVAHPTEEVEGAVPHGDESLAAEHNCLAPVCRLGELGEHNASHARLQGNKENIYMFLGKLKNLGHSDLYEDAEDTLDTHNEDGTDTLRGGGPPPVSETYKYYVLYIILYYIYLYIGMYIVYIIIMIINYNY